MFIEVFQNVILWAVVRWRKVIRALKFLNIGRDFVRPPGPIDSENR